MLNYLGQGALLLSNPEAVQNPFFYMAPEWARLPLVGIATLATIIASQAVISGAFSVTRQAVQLGFLPRLSILHTSAKAAGQIYIPIVNWTLLVLVVLLVLGFGESTKLASAYGIAVTGTMFITTCMLAVVLFRVWKWNPILAGLVIGTFFIVDAAYFASNLTKIADGGWFPLLVAAVVFIVLTTWATGRRLLRERLAEGAIPLSVFIKSTAGSLHRVRGTSVFMASSAETIPSALLHNIKHNQVLHERVVILTVQIEEVPHVAPESRAEVTRCRRRLLPGRPALWLHGRDRRAARPGAGRRCRRAVQHDDHQLLPRPAEADRLQAARHGAVARAAVRLDEQEQRKRDGILRPADQPGGRARQPAGDLSDAGFGRLG